jgi:hypothetical protein
VTLQSGMRWATAFVLGSLLAAVGLNSLAVAGAASPDKKDKPKAESQPIVDSGSFGIFIRDKRVATETFHIEQQNGNSLIKSQLKETGSSEAAQKSDLDISSAGELLRYEWSQSSGGSLEVMPNNDFLMEKTLSGNSSKPAEQPFLMPTTTTILDNNFFIHREVLAWRYLAADCKTEAGNLKCPQDPADFGALVPQDRLSMPVRMVLVGKEKVSIRGVDRQLLHLKLTGESFDWSLWLDDQDHYKLIRVSIPADSTEVVRD